jgi:hypothetical protein
MHVARLHECNCLDARSEAEQVRPLTKLFGSEADTDRRVCQWRVHENKVEVLDAKGVDATVDGFSGCGLELVCNLGGDAQLRPCNSALSEGLSPMPQRRDRLWRSIKRRCVRRRRASEGEGWESDLSNLPLISI